MRKTFVPIVRALVLRRYLVVQAIALTIGFLSLSMRSAHASPDILDNTDALELAVYDDPLSIFSSIVQKYEDLKSQPASLQWIRALWFLAAIEAESARETPLTKAVIKDAITQAITLQAEREWVALSILRIQIELERDAAPLSQVASAYEAVISEVERFKDPTLAAPVMIAYATQLLYGNDLPSALELIRRADELLSRTSDSRFFDRIALMSAKADLLDFQNRKEEAIPIYRDVIAQLEKRGARRMTSVKLQDLAITLLRTKNKTLEAEGFILIQKALALSEKLKDQVTVASCKMHMANYFAGLRDRKKAETLSLESVQLIETTKNENWIGYLNWFRASIMLRLQNWNEALQYADKAIEHYPTADLNNRINIHDIRYEAYKQLKRYDKALENLEGYLEGYKEIAVRHENEQYNRASAKLGLQLEREKNLNLEKERQLQQQKLDQRRQESNLFKNFAVILGLLSLATVGLLLRSIYQSQKLQKRKNEIQLILDSIDQGLFTINKNRLIDDNVSKHLAKILGSGNAFIGKDFVDVIFQESDMSAEVQSMVVEVLRASLGEDSLAWEMNESNLPREFRRKGRLLTIRWIPVFDSHGVLQRLLISIVDVTKERELEKAVGFHKKQLQSLPDILQSLLKAQPDLVKHLLASTGVVLSRLEKEGPLPQLIRDLHTQKGVARSLGLRSLSEHLHELEGSLKASQAEPQRQHDLLADITRVQDNLKEYEAYAFILNSKISSEGHGQGSLLSSAIEPLLPVWVEQMNDAGLPLAAVTVNDRCLNWNADRLAVVRDICLHAINNSLDHGFRLPKARGLSVNCPEIEVTAERFSSSLRLIIADNGAGLDTQRVVELCRSKGLDPEKTGTDVFFMDGVTTADKLTLTSGRGVGLAAIRSRVEELGGSASIRNRSDARGTQLIIQLPYDFPGVAPLAPVQGTA